MTAKFSLPRTRYAGDGEARRFIQGLLENVRSIPGVRGSGATTYLPFSSGMNASMITLEGYSMAPGELPPVPAWNTVDSGYFQAMGIPLLAGRGFVESDTAEARPVVVIDQFLARKYWPNGNPIGAGLRRGMSAPGDTPRPLCTVIGVIGTVKARTLAEQNPVGQIYFYYKQFPPRSMHLVVRTDRDDAQFAGALRARIARADPELPLYDVKTMPQRVSASVLDRRAAAVLCLAFAGLALLLAAIGLYGVLAYTVTQRTREFGIRVALGAGRADVLRMVVGQGLKLAALGLAIGGAAAFATVRLMSAMLYGVRAGDPGVFLAVAGSLMVVALVAALIPSLRAIRIHPAGALRYE
jgi:predicted permease